MMGSRLNAECMLKGLGLTDEFSALIIGAECERAKPFPDPYLKGLEELGIEAHEAIAFEDSPSGRLLAHSCCYSITLLALWPRV